MLLRILKSLKERRQLTYREWVLSLNTHKDSGVNHIDPAENI